PRQQPRPTRLPYTTLFRSAGEERAGLNAGVGERRLREDVAGGDVELVPAVEIDVEERGAPARTPQRPPVGVARGGETRAECLGRDRKSTRLNSSHRTISYA